MSLSEASTPPVPRHDSAKAAPKHARICRIGSKILDEQTGVPAKKLSPWLVTPSSKAEHRDEIMKWQAVGQMTTPWFSLPLRRIGIPAPSFEGPQRRSPAAERQSRLVKRSCRFPEQTTHYPPMGQQTDRPSIINRDSNWRADMKAPRRKLQIPSGTPRHSRICSHCFPTADQAFSVPSRISAESPTPRWPCRPRRVLFQPA